MGIFSRIFGKTSQKSDDMVWADEFTLQMGLEFDDLFGIFAMPQSFADAPRLLKIFYGMINTDRSAASVGCSREERFSRLHNVISGCSQREQEALMKFWNFFGDVCVRIRNNPDFGREIRNLPKDHYKNWVADKITRQQNVVGFICLKSKTIPVYCIKII